MLNLIFAYMCDDDRMCIVQMICSELEISSFFFSFRIGHGSVHANQNASPEKEDEFLLIQCIK